MIEPMSMTGRTWDEIDEDYVRAAGNALMPIVWEYFSKKEEICKDEEGKARMKVFEEMNQSDLLIFGYKAKNLVGSFSKINLFIWCN